MKLPLPSPLFLILATVTLDAVGIGIVMPVLPGLLRAVTNVDNVAWHVGVLVSIYALMQLVCAPVLGALSDRFGRRPVLMGSLAGATMDYIIMALAPVLWVLYVGRVISGITGATGAVAGAYIADVTEGEKRTKQFGMMGACFGLGFIAGPAIGGIVGDISLHAPFVVAAMLNGLNLLMTVFLLPETHKGERRKVDLRTLNPVASFKWAKSLPLVPALMVVFFTMCMVGQVPGTLWVVYGEDRLQWTTSMVGVSLAVFGILHAGLQAFVTGWVTKRLGERWTVLLGMGFDTAGYVLMAFVTATWMVVPAIVLLASGGIGMPAMQGLLSNQVGDDRQGQLQGALTSLGSGAMVLGPLVFSAIYASTAHAWNGWVWIVGAGLYVLCIPALRTMLAQHKA